jgi:hypothetical protein
MPRFNEILHHCEHKCQPKAGYLKMATAENNPNISAKMRYSEIVRTSTPITVEAKKSTFVQRACPGINKPKYKCNNSMFVNSNH